MRPARSVRRDPAVRDAHEVVGLYGDPDTSWGIAVDLTVREPRHRSARPTGWPRCVRRHDHLGAAPVVEVVGEA